MEPNETYSYKYTYVSAKPGIAMITYFSHSRKINGSPQIFLKSAVMISVMQIYL